jgi:hypothetical protein
MDIYTQAYGRFKKNAFYAKEQGLQEIGRSVRRGFSYERGESRV